MIAVDREVTFDALEQWWDLWGMCGRCDREGRLDRYDLARRFSSGCFIHSLSARLRCRECGNKGQHSGNRFVLKKLRR